MKPVRIHLRGPRGQQGVMLLEALVGILIFSIGILALIAMQGVAMKNTNDARYRSEASFLATQIISQMWVDRTNLASYDTDGTAYTIRDNWLTSVEANLPGINLATSTRSPTIDVDTTTNQVTVTIQWLQPGETETRRVQIVNTINGAT